MSTSISLGDIERLPRRRPDPMGSGDLFGPADPPRPSHALARLDVDIQRYGAAFLPQSRGGRFYISDSVPRSAERARLRAALVEAATGQAGFAF